MYYDSCTNYESIEREKGSPLLEIMGIWFMEHNQQNLDFWLMGFYEDLGSNAQIP